MRNYWDTEREQWIFSEYEINFAPSEEIKKKMIEYNDTMATVRDLEKALDKIIDERNAEIQAILEQARKLDGDICWELSPHAFDPDYDEKTGED